MSFFDAVTRYRGPTVRAVLAILANTRYLSNFVFQLESALVIESNDLLYSVCTLRHRVTEHFYQNLPENSGGASEGRASFQFLGGQPKSKKSRSATLLEEGG
jgi:hypothetical protein